ncbi:MAG TPA: DUF169 domain-containing protein [Candidatus Krumholzibacteria bacterium]|nr:DUF169 domain-containing protein [Candidatus Krumholzibacteria bacterium]HPD70219.1 DUF169 domain-containing protein [Candidatus Krumholzibacteria bacterium]HRY40081.1 DUF169 domain-containing protein [Candidatus Krumholzibacteria bacterium]
MPSRLLAALALKHRPLAILLANDRPDGALQFKERRWGCVAAMLLAAEQGKTVVFDRETYGCPGGGVGLGFGCAYKGFPIDHLLSTGGTFDLPGGQTRDFGEGERFLASPAVARRWVASVPIRDVPAEYVVVKPLDQLAAGETPILAWLLVNPDQLSALVTLANFRRGRLESVIAPWGAACQSILFAMVEAERPEPRGVIGFFDISQRHRIGRDLLSFTLPWRTLLEMDEDAAASFLRSEPWLKLRERQ